MQDIVFFAKKTSIFLFFQGKCGRKLKLYPIIASIFISVSSVGISPTS